MGFFYDGIKFSKMTNRCIANYHAFSTAHYSLICFNRHLSTFWLSNLYKWACVTELRVGAGRTSMLLLVSWLAQQLHLQPVEINGGSGQLWLCVEQMAEEWPFLLLWHAQQHTNGSALITGHIISWSQGSGLVGLCNKGNGISSNIFSSDLKWYN